MNPEFRNEKESDRKIFYGFCGFPNKFGVLFCGAVTFLVGSLWLMENLGVIPNDWWEFVLPTILISWGLFYILAYFRIYKS